MVDTKPVKQEANGTVILPPLVFPDSIITFILNYRHSNDIGHFGSQGPIL